MIPYFTYSGRFDFPLQPLTLAHVCINIAICRTLNKRLEITKEAEYLCLSSFILLNHTWIRLHDHLQVSLLNFEIRLQLFYCPVMDRTILGGAMSTSQEQQWKSGSMHHFHFRELILEILVHAPHSCDARISLRFGLLFQVKVGLMSCTGVMNICLRG